MDDALPDVYYLETVEQLRVLADELRQRILVTLRAQPMTVTQIGERLALSPAKIHYHVRELERVGLVRLVATREKGGILEKYFQPVARDVLVSPALLRSLSADDQVATISAFVAEIERNLMRALASGAGVGAPEQPTAGISRNHLWLTDEEFPLVSRAIDLALEPYQQPRDRPGERERTFIQMMYDTAAGAEESTQAEQNGAAPARAPRLRRTISAGAVSWDRGALERAVSRGEMLDMTALGYLAFADDIPPELADRAIARLRHRGLLRATPEVRAVLRRKEG